VNARLRAIQRRYYRGDESAIPEYFAALAAARKALNLPNKTALHLGSGAYHIEGWINVDLIQDRPDVVADLTRTLPFASESADYIHTEDFIEHVELEHGRAFLRECFRVLRPRGVMRLLTPDLDALVRRVYLDRERRHIAWCANSFGTTSAAEALNMHMRMNGDHRFIYDDELLAREMKAAGFRVRRVRYNRSPEPFLRFLDVRDFGLNLFFEGVKG
jgi:predicted SAM-dependent methyltransferase